LNVALTHSNFIGIQAVQAALPRFRKKRKQVKSVDAVVYGSPQGSQIGTIRPEDGLNHTRRGKQYRKFYGQFQSPRQTLLKETEFTKRNNSETKRVEPLKRNKPLSLMSSMKKFEIETDPIVKYYNSKFNYECIYSANKLLLVELRNS
jgi:hypothetical protein